MPANLSTLDVLPELHSNALMSSLNENAPPLVDDQPVFVVKIADPERFDRVAKEAKAAFSHMSEQELNDLIDEAVQWARSPDARHY